MDNSVLICEQIISVHPHPSLAGLRSDAPNAGPVNPGVTYPLLANAGVFFILEMARNP